MNTNTSGIKIYPNPVNDYFYLKTNEDACKTIQIVDIHGKTIAYFSCDNNKTQRIDFKSAAAGIYFVVIQFENRKEIIKILKL